jgi:hypothetical protein
MWARWRKRVFDGIANTVAAVFPHVYFAQHFSPQESSLFTNRLIVASAQTPEKWRKVFPFPMKHGESLATQ